MQNLKRWKALIDDVNMDIYAVTDIHSIIPKEPEPPSEEEQLKQFIKDYIDEPVPKFSWRDALQKQLAYSAMYGGRGMGKSFAYHNLTVMDDPPIVHEKVTLKPTKKQAKLLKKFRKLKRFKC